MPPIGAPLRLLTSTSASISRQCSRRLARQPVRASYASTLAGPRLQDTYFVSNSLLAKFAGSRRNAAIVTSEAARPATQYTANKDAAIEAIQDNVLPHRRRQAARLQATAHYQPSTPDEATMTPADLPSNASSTLTTLSASHPKQSLRRTLSALLALSKPRLTVLVVLSAVAPYALYPVPAFMSAADALGETAPSLSPLTLFFLTTGTALCSASANALNMLYEPATDALMTRTRNRPLVRGDLISLRTAALFAIVAGGLGIGLLYVGVNPTVSFLGGANIFLYAGMYTPLKAVTWLNTWVGAVVGGIPPLMGWVAAAGESATGDGNFRELLFSFPASWTGSVTQDSTSLTSNGASNSAGGWLLAALLFAWQFPHFMALSWPVREEYKVAGLKMLSWVNPARNARVALRYSLVFVPICVGLCAVDVTEWSFAVTSLPVNIWLAREAVRFWRFEGHGGSARGLFWASVWHLPVVMVLALVQKKGMWSRVWNSVFGQPLDMEEEDDEDDDEEWDGGEEGELTPIPVAVRVDSKES